jgi:hypothetical protein
LLEGDGHYWQESSAFLSISDSPTFRRQNSSNVFLVFRTIQGFLILYPQLIVLEHGSWKTWGHHIQPITWRIIDITIAVTGDKDGEKQG